MYISRIISSGKDGVECGALEAAKGLHFSCGMPCSYNDDDGFVSMSPEEKLVSDDPDEQKVFNSDATLILAMSRELDGCTLRTKELCERYKKPCLVWDLNDRGLTTLSPQNDVIKWLSERLDRNSVDLNVVGPCESDCPGIQQRAKEFVESLLNMMPEVQVRKMLAKSVKPEELDDAVEWAITAGSEAEDVLPFIEWAERYRPTSEYEVAQMSFHLGKSDGWREPTRESSYKQATLWQPKTVVKYRKVGKSRRLEHPTIRTMFKVVALFSSAVFAILACILGCSWLVSLIIGVFLFKASMLVAQISLYRPCAENNRKYDEMSESMKARILKGTDCASLDDPWVKWHMEQLKKA